MLHCISTLCIEYYITISYSLRFITLQSMWLHATAVNAGMQTICRTPLSLFFSTSLVFTYYLICSSIPYIFLRYLHDLSFKLGFIGQERIQVFESLSRGSYFCCTILHRSTIPVLVRHLSAPTAKDIERRDGWTRSLEHVGHIHECPLPKTPRFPRNQHKLMVQTKLKRKMPK